MAKKDLRNYFSHDADARNDDKIIRLRMRHGAAGYGVFFMILERLRCETDYMSVRDYNMIAFDLRVDASLIKSVIEDFGLFAFTEDGKYIYSESFLRRMEIKDCVSRKRREAVARRWDKESSPTDSHSPSIASSIPQNTNGLHLYSQNDTNVSENGYNKSKGKYNKKISPDGDTKKDDTPTAAAIVEDLNIPSGLGPEITDILRRLLIMAPVLASGSGFPVDDIRATATRVASEWNCSGEYSRRDPVSHLRNTVMKILRKQRDNGPPSAAGISPLSDLQAEKEAERRRLDEIYTRDSAAELAAFKKSQGLSPSDSLMTLVNDKANPKTPPCIPTTRSPG